MLFKDVKHFLDGWAKSKVKRSINLAEFTLKKQKSKGANENFKTCLSFSVRCIELCKEQVSVWAANLDGVGEKTGVGWGGALEQGSPLAKDVALLLRAG